MLDARTQFRVITLSDSGSPIARIEVIAWYMQHEVGGTAEQGKDYTA